MRRASRSRWLAASLWALGLSGVVAARASAEFPVAPDARRADGLAAVIEGSSTAGETLVILRSDVEFWARLEVSGKSGGPALGPLPDGLLAAALDELLGEALLAREAAGLGLDDPSEGRVRAQRASLAEMAGGEVALVELSGALGVGEREIETIARRRAIVAGFLQANLVGTAEVTTAEVERAYEAGAHPFVGKPLEEVREALRQWLGRERTRCAVLRWVQGLRERAEIRLLASYANTEVGVDPERCGKRAPAKRGEPTPSGGSP